MAKVVKPHVREPFLTQELRPCGRERARVKGSTLARVHQEIVPLPPGAREEASARLIFALGLEVGAKERRERERDDLAELPGTSR
ncbi:MAG: hypothetical protein HY240_09195 [Actinobacteria bacterium]|nr:hypothetical protein [Actinomycetota bacterium]